MAGCVENLWYNEDHNGAWCVPKKDTPEYKAVVDIIERKTYGTNRCKGKNTKRPAAEKGENKSVLIRTRKSEKERK